MKRFYVRQLNQIADNYERLIGGEAEMAWSNPGILRRAAQYLETVETELTEIVNFREAEGLD